MYTGENKTAQLSQQLLGKAMLRLLQYSAFSDISISALCKEARVSRQTFYTLFGTKENVLLYELQNSCCFEPEKKTAACRSDDFRMFCRSYSRYIIEKKNLLSLLVKNKMMHCLYDVQYESFMACEYFMHDITGDDRIYLIDFIASGMNSIAKNYVITGCRADEAFLEQLMHRLFGEIYFTMNYHHNTGSIES